MLKGKSDEVQIWRPSGARRARAGRTGRTVSRRRSSAGTRAAAGQGPVPHHRSGRDRAARVGHRSGRGRQVAARLGVREARRRSRRRRPVAPGPVPGLRGRHRVRRPGRAGARSGWAWPRASRPTRPRTSSRAASRAGSPDAAEREFVGSRVARLLGLPVDGGGARARACRPVRGLAPVLRAAGRGPAVWCWSSRTCTVRTPACWTSSSTCWTGARRAVCHPDLRPPGAGRSCGPASAPTGTTAPSWPGSARRRRDGRAPGRAACRVAPDGRRPDRGRGPGDPAVRRGDRADARSTTGWCSRSTAGTRSSASSGR